VQASSQPVVHLLLIVQIIDQLSASGLFSEIAETALVLNLALSV
jgi:hypothetical protein